MPRTKRLPQSIVVLTDDTGNITNIACAETEPIPKPRKPRSKVSHPLAPKKPVATIRIEHGDFKISFN